MGAVLDTLKNIETIEATEAAYRWVLLRTVLSGHGAKGPDRRIVSYFRALDITERESIENAVRKRR